jgi:hypothetical protein
LPQPYIVGFEYSRPNDPEADSELVAEHSNLDLYRHPHSLGPKRKRFCRAFDIYSLGVMLLEVGYWRQVLQFTKDSYTPDRLLNDLLKFHIPRLLPKTGGIYANVVRSCLEGILTDTGLDDAESQRRFYWSVVSELERLVV